MNTHQIKLLLDSCFAAKRITETMESLPDGFKPRHIHVIDCIFSLGERGEEVRVGDVSRQMAITTPSVTKLLHELEEKGAVEKYSLGDDKRVILLKLTALGKAYQDKYVTKYHTAWAQNLPDVTEEQVQTAITVIARLQEAMPKRGDDER